jgi:CRP-like cAMP-binding protein
MLATAPPAFRNRLLCALADDDLDLLRPHLTAVSLAVRRPLERPNRRIDDAFFIESGIASVVALQGKDVQVEVGLIGREGMTGLPIVLGDHRTPHSTYVQVRGEARRIGAIELRAAMQASASLQSFLLKFVQAFMVQRQGAIGGASPPPPTGAKRRSRNSALQSLVKTAGFAQFLRQAAASRAAAALQQAARITIFTQR